MNELESNHSNKLRIISVIILMIGCIILLLFLPSLIWSKPTAHAAAINPIISSKNPGTNNSPNVITSGLFNSVDGLHKAADSSQRAIYNGSRAIRLSLVSAATSSARFIGHSTIASVNATGHALNGSAHFIGNAATKTFALASNVTKVSTLITPASADKTPIPAITSTPVILANEQSQTTTSNTAQPAAQTQNDSSPQWPIHGVVTLEFGVPHWPYQPIHTGIDISDGMPWGVTPVHPFESGIVIEAVHSSYGFGNHVVIKHSSGITSLYGHMASISAQVGQKVDKATILGYEGSTGASTGVHVHFEIELNGQPVNPRRYVGGQP